MLRPTLSHVAGGALLLALLVFTGCASTPYGPLAATFPAPTAPRATAAATGLRVAVQGVDQRRPADGLGYYVTMDGERMKIVDSNRSFDFSGMATGLAQALTAAGYTVDPTAPVTVTATLDKMEVTMQECSKWGVNMATEYKAELSVDVSAGGAGLASKSLKERHYGESYHALRDRAKSTDAGIYMAIYMPNEEGILARDLGLSLSKMFEQAAASGQLRTAVADYYAEHK